MVTRVAVFAGNLRATMSAGLCRAFPMDLDALKAPSVRVSALVHLWFLETLVTEHGAVVHYGYDLVAAWPGKGSLAGLVQCGDRLRLPPGWRAKVCCLGSEP